MQNTQTTPTDRPLANPTQFGAGPAISALDPSDNMPYNVRPFVELLSIDQIAGQEPMFRKIERISHIIVDLAQNDSDASLLRGTFEGLKVLQTLRDAFELAGPLCNKKQEGGQPK